ncbi:MAG: [FeFe] hydrogenase H-cluster maturation GTPase HydF [Clostridiales bacterium]|nr:MAG: [FeFe] hydrogenase H-cluster maturation GTPase HydF [Clostridiales bacterium]
MSLNDTPRANRLHIAIFGKRNSGKSSLINAITGQPVAVVSDVAGTTTDPVYKTMEIHGIGACVLIDTAGFDDEGSLGEMRVEKTLDVVEKTDIAVLLFSEGDLSFEKRWLETLRKKKTPVLGVINKADILKDVEDFAEKIKSECNIEPVVISAKNNINILKVREKLIEMLPEDYEISDITAGLCEKGDTVLLVMPQDIQAPKGRLILPQVQTLRNLLDKKCLVMSTTTDMLEQALSSMVKEPDLIITDSQVFKTVYEKKPASSKLTSFSVLFARYKGDISEFVEGAKAIDLLNENSKVLIAEACTHAPLSEDIGREKIPRMLRQRFGEELTVDIVSGAEFPEYLSDYDLIIHCGACMFNRKYVLSRIEKARAAGVKITNYGVVIAHLSGILDKIYTGGTYNG